MTLICQGTPAQLPDHWNEQAWSGKETNNLGILIVFQFRVIINDAMKEFLDMGPEIHVESSCDMKDGVLQSCVKAE